MAEDTNSYPWARTWEWFFLGLGRAVFLTLTPVGWILWKWVYAWGNYPIDWSTVWQLALACGAPAAALYWNNHRHLLKSPISIPDEFLATNPNLRTVAQSASVTVPTETGTRTVTVTDKHVEPAVPTDGK